MRLVSVYLPDLGSSSNPLKVNPSFRRASGHCPAPCILKILRRPLPLENWACASSSTVKNTAATLVVDLVLITLAAFAFSKLKMKFKKFFYYFILINMLIPTPIILLPMYLQVLNMNIQNTLAAIVFPYYQGFAPLGLVLATNYFNNIPDEVIEAARIDGCNTPKVLISIVVPLAKPILTTLAILGGMNAWNEYMWSLTSISNTSRYTLSVRIATLRDQTSIFRLSAGICSIVCQRHCLCHSVFVCTENLCGIHYSRSCERLIRRKPYAVRKRSIYRRIV